MLFTAVTSVTDRQTECTVQQTKAYKRCVHRRFSQHGSNKATQPSVVMVAYKMSIFTNNQWRRGVRGGGARWCSRSESDLISFFFHLLSKSL